MTYVGWVPFTREVVLIILYLESAAIPIQVSFGETNLFELADAEFARKDGVLYTARLCEGNCVDGVRGFLAGYRDLGCPFIRRFIFIDYEVDLSLL